MFSLNGAPLQNAVEKGNIEIVKLLLTCQNIEINYKLVLNFYINEILKFFI